MTLGPSTHTVYVPSLSVFRSVPFRAIPVSFRSVSSRALAFRFVPFRTIPFRPVSFRLVPLRSVPFRFEPYRLFPFRIAPFRSVSSCLPFHSVPIHSRCTPRFAVRFPHGRSRCTMSTYFVGAVNLTLGGSPRRCMDDRRRSCSPISTWRL